MFQVFLSIEGRGQNEALRVVIICSDEQAVCWDGLFIAYLDKVAHSQILATDFPLSTPLLVISSLYANVNPCICALVFTPSSQIREALSEHSEENHEYERDYRGKRVVRTDRRGALEDRIDHIEDVRHAEELDEAGNGKECKTIFIFV